MDTAFMPKEGLDDLIRQLADSGYRVFGPTVRAGAVVFDRVDSAAQLPVGLASVQEPGRYRLEESGNRRFFDFVNGHESLKRFTFASQEKLWSFSADGTFQSGLSESPRTAVIGARACDIAGMKVQDRTFLKGKHSPHTDPYYADRRRNLFVVAVNCTVCVSTCFCASQNAGPMAEDGFDISLTELEDGFVVKTGSAAGEAIAAKLDLIPPKGAKERAEESIKACAQAQVRYIDNDGIYELLFNNLEHPRWDDVAERCLSCANCVMVCPTCFCHREVEVPSMDGIGSDHVRQWDACFTLEHGSTHGRHLRPEVRQRYRQWLTHKVGAWWEQFETSGCVGCGRCITWCPTGIDLTEEIAAIRAQPGEKAS